MVDGDEGAEPGGAPRTLRLRATPAGGLRWGVFAVAAAVAAYRLLVHDGLWAVAAGAAFLVASGVVVLRRRAVLTLHPYGMTVRSFGRRRTYAWRDVTDIRPLTFSGRTSVRVEVRQGAHPRRVFLERYGFTVAELCSLLTGYQAQALAARDAVAPGRRAAEGFRSRLRESNP